MELLKGKKGLVVGVANDHSIAWGIAQALHGAGAELAFSYAGEPFERRVSPLAESLNAPVIAPCDVQSDEQIAALMSQVKDAFGSLDILIHGAAFARREELGGQFINTSRDGFQQAMDISVFSLTALAKAAEAAVMIVPGRTGRPNWRETPAARLSRGASEKFVTTR